MKTTRSILLACAACAACAAACAGGEAPQPAVSADPELALLERAHRAYLDDDLPALLHAVEGVVGAPGVDPDLRENALELLDRAYAEHDGALPASWDAPPGVKRLELLLVHATEPGLERYRLSLRGVIDDPARLTTLRLTQLPGGTVLLDREAGSGTFTVEPEDDGGSFFELEGDEVASPPPSGLYELTLGTRDGELTSALVVLDRLVSSRTPAVEEPAPFAVIEGPRPLLRVEDFRSPEHQGFEARSLGLWLVREEEGGVLRQVWSSWASPPGATEVTLGDGPLAPGRYWIAVTFGERRRAGPLRLVRGSRTLRPFEIR